MPPAQPLILAIETSNPSAWTPDQPIRAGVALGLADAGGVAPLGVEPVDVTKPHDDDLLPAIDRLFVRLGRRPAELGLVAVSVGPGGYTALRIAVTVGRFIAWSVGARVVGIASARVVAARVTEPGPFAVALASKGDDAFVTRFRSPNEPEGAGSLLDRDGLEGLSVRCLVADRFLPEPMRARAVDLGMRVVAPVFDPLALLDLSSGSPPGDPAALHPLYPREPEAVVKWRALRARRP
ncbi:MAG: tRNA threonylcarbamoyladenosine biosynthesis protein TsaB [Phycisphaerae bacterium]|nr:tRNA threonylcarbamoyladenosine biosynthesis protein TsaB [Phycisphaerae bacterium]